MPTNVLEALKAEDMDRTAARAQRVVEGGKLLVCGRLMDLGLEFGLAARFAERLQPQLERVITDACEGDLVLLAYAERGRMRFEEIDGIEPARERWKALEAAGGSGLVLNLSKICREAFALIAKRIENERSRRN